MNDTSKAAALEKLSYLWTSGEWGLHCSHRSRARVFLVFGNGYPSAQELVAVRALVPRYANAPVATLKKEVGRLREMAVGDFGGIAARRFSAAAHERGLKVRTEDVSSIGYVPVRTGGGALLIEDDEVAALVVEEMLRRGMPVTSREEVD